MWKHLRMAVLSLAAMARREEVTQAVMSGKPNPMQDQPDWLIGWGILKYRGHTEPGAKRFYDACANEWYRRKYEKPVAELADKGDLYTRCEIRVPSKLIPPHGTKHPMELAAVRLPQGTIHRGEYIADHGAVRVYIVDVPPNSNITELHPDIKVSITGMGTGPDPKG